jgi:hypothetical protein
VSEELWAGVDHKVGNAEFFIDAAERSLTPPTRSITAGNPPYLPLQWERSFYANLDAFLVTARSVPEIINCCFGKDTATDEMKEWFRTLDDNERCWRDNFVKEYRKELKEFRKLLLSTQRNISFHRIGYPSINIKITGRYGIHAGSPINSLPASETEPLVDRNTDALKWAATEPPPPVIPLANDFSIAGAPLFSECRAYLEKVKDLVIQARAIAECVHGAGTLTGPP